MFFENGKLYFDIFRKRLSSFGCSRDSFLAGPAPMPHSMVVTKSSLVLKT